MKKNTFTIILLFCSIAILSQTADERIKNLINQQDYFELDRQYPLLKDSMQNDMLCIVVEAWLAHYFNRPEAACILFEKLNTDYRDQMGQNIMFMYRIWAEDLIRIGRAKEAEVHMQNLAQQYPPGSEEAKGFQSMAENALMESHFPISELIRPNQNTIIPFSMEPCGSGELMKVHVKINGNSIPFIFDTGAASVNHMSQQLAQKCNLRIIEDSIIISGLDSSTHARLAIADSIQIGDIIYRNVLFSISSSILVNSVCQIDALFGGRFLDDIGEFQIDNKLNQLIFPIKETPLPITGRNLMRNKNKPYLEVISEKERLFFLFDTGYNFSNLSGTYYNKHRDKIEKEGIKTIVHFVGIIEEIKEIPSYTLSSFPIQVGSTKSKIPRINVQVIPSQKGAEPQDGVLGMDFLRMFDKITVNYNHMFVKVE